MSDVKWLPGNRISTTLPKKLKKITGIRFAAIMGLNKWNSEFKTWCEVTKTWQEPFVDTIYTRAGKAIEPKQAAYMKKAYLMDNLVTPEDKFGKDYFKKTFGDFFPKDPILGGMWDYLLEEDGKPTTVLEMKTTKRSEDWAEDVPEYYAMQAALYAWLLGVDDVIMVCSFLEEGDYDDPDKFVPDSTNTITVPFKVSERYPDFDDRVAYAIDWWNRYVLTGTSPAYNPVTDADIIKELRQLHPDTVEIGLNALLNEGAEIQRKLDQCKAEMKPLEDRLKAIKDAVKEDALPQFGDSYDKVHYGGADAPYIWTVARTNKTSIDEAALKRDGLLEKYKTKVTTTYTLTIKENKEDK